MRVSNETGKTVEYLSESNWVFDQTPFKDVIHRWLRSGHLVPEGRVNEVLQMVCASA